MKRTVASAALVASTGVIAVILSAGAAHAAGATSAPDPTATTSAYPPPVVTTSLSVAVLGTEVSQDPSAALPAVQRAATTVGSTSDALPFTGADIAGTAVLGLGLIGGGGAAVVATRRRRGSHR